MSRHNTVYAGLDKQRLNKHLLILDFTFEIFMKYHLPYYCHHWIHNCTIDIHGFTRTQDSPNTRENFAVDIQTMGVRPTTKSMSQKKPK